MIEIEVAHTRVFAASEGGGNRCPVVLNASALTDRQMLELARRFGLDTAFVFPPSVPGASLCVRYFVPDHEMGISGHATVAALTVAIERGHRVASPSVIETVSGLFEISADVKDGRVEVTLEQRPPVFGDVAASDEVAAVLGISPRAVDDRASPAQSVSVSRAKLLVPLRDTNTLASLDPRFDEMWALCDRLNVTGLYPFTRVTDRPGVDVEARQFPLRAGFPEDAATGVAAAALGAYIVRYDRATAGQAHIVRVAQGYAMGAPSRIDALIECRDGAILRTAIRGSAHIDAWETEPTPEPSLAQ